MFKRGNREVTIEAASERLTCTYTVLCVCNSAGLCGCQRAPCHKPSSVFISLGRGAVVDEAALANALATRSIRGAVLDVFTVEPLPKSSPLWDLDNVLLTAHNADLTANYFELGWNVWTDNLERFLGGESTLATPVDVANGY